jgi:hypothetical protein
MLRLLSKTEEATHRIYVAGPMRGYEAHNFPAFDEASAHLRQSGWDVVNPADLDRNEFGYTGEEEVSSDLVKYMLIRDLKELFKCTAIALMPGWTNSVGARLEATTAASIGLEMFLYNPKTRKLSPRTNQYILDYLKGEQQ